VLFVRGWRFEDSGETGCEGFRWVGCGRKKGSGWCEWMIEKISLPGISVSCLGQLEKSNGHDTLA
jgi:hypothetical protein